jgi:hypothetical protein
MTFEGLILRCRIPIVQRLHGRQQRPSQRDQLRDGVGAGLQPLCQRFARHETPNAEPRAAAVHDLPQRGERDEIDLTQHFLFVFQTQPAAGCQ